MHESDLGPGRPDADECQPYYFTYIDLVPDAHVLELLERQIAERVAFLATFTPEQALWREAPGEWNVVEIVGHLADTERVFGYRALRIARADPVMWTKVEFAGAAFIAFLRGLDGAAWKRRAPADWTLRSVRAVAYTMAGHELHHLASIRRQHGK